MYLQGGKICTSQYKKFFRTVKQLFCLTAEVVLEDSIKDFWLKEQFTLKW